MYVHHVAFISRRRCLSLLYPMIFSVKAFLHFNLIEETWLQRKISTQFKQQPVYRRLRKVRTTTRTVLQCYTLDKIEEECSLAFVLNRCKLDFFSSSSTASSRGSRGSRGWHRSFDALSDMAGGGLCWTSTEGEVACGAAASSNMWKKCWRMLSWVSRL